MKPRFRFGLIVGLVGLVLNVCVAGFMGICGPFMALLAGAAAGFLATRQENPETKRDGARLGAVAGVIAGALVLVGQLLGGLGALTFIQSSGIELGIGTIPAPSAELSPQLLYYTSGLMTGLCFGLVGAALAAGAGAAAGYLTASQRALIVADD